MPSSSLAAPRLARLVLPGNLATTETESLQEEGQHEAERLTGADLSERGLRGLALSECEWTDVRLSGADLTAGRFADTMFTSLDAAVFTAARSDWRDVEVARSRLGSADLYDAQWQSVRFTDCKLGYLNLRGARLKDVVFERCTIDELDLGGANALRVALLETDVGTLDLTRATLQHVDLRGAELSTLVGVEHLRGAIVSEYQLQQLAGMIAQQLGIIVR